MHIIDAGTFTVNANGPITINIRKAVAPYQAMVSDLIGATWAPRPRVAGQTAFGGFTAPSVPGTIVQFTVVYDFTPSADGSFPPGDQYTTTIGGRPDESTFTDQIGPPPLQSRTYQFTVI